MKRTKLTFTGLSVLFAIVAILAGATDTAAQGRYVGQLSRNDVDQIIKRLEDSGDEFNRDFRRELSNSNLSSSQKRTYNNQSNDFENATDRLRSKFDNDNSWWESRTQVQNVISSARPLNQTMLSIGFRRNVERQWNRLRNDVNKLADTYDLPGIAGGGWNGGPWNPGNPGNPGWGGGGQTSPPSWARGTWYWMNGPDRRMTIDNNGRITLFNQGNTSYGSYMRNGTINLDGNISTLTRNGNNIRTYNQSSGETSDYGRNPWNGGGGGWNPGNPGGGNTSRPPSWAVGTWNWVNGGGRTMTIQSNGRITLNNQGSTSYGTYYNGVITLDGIQSTLSRNGNRIRTYNQATGEVSDYRKQ